MPPQSVPEFPQTFVIMGGAVTAARIAPKNVKSCDFRALGRSQAYRITPENEWPFPCITIGEGLLPSLRADAAGFCYNLAVIETKTFL
jgi:hypothetical protein